MSHKMPRQCEAPCGTCCISIFLPSYLDDGVVRRFSTAVLYLSDSTFKVTLDGDVLLQEANNDLEKIREELNAKKQKLVVLN